MGFSLFCSSSISSKLKTAYLFDVQGQLQRLDLPITVGELIFDSPGYIICPVDELRVSRVIWVLRANEELRDGEFYMVLPDKRAYSKVSESEWQVIKAACKKKKGGKVVPVGLLENEGEKDHRDTSHSTCKSANSKQWRPMLEPIYEAS
ncbi:hypothetical protein ACHQM5_026314 [Ranunculus cassubicifolius]